MPELPQVRSDIFVEETQFRAAVSEAVAQKLGSSINFINNRQYSEKQFFINGNYGLLTYPLNDVDGFTFFQFDSTIIDVWMFIQFAGTGGTTELDIKKATTPGGSFTSIFTTTPKITSAAGNNVWINIGAVLSGATAPVLALTDFLAGTALRLDIIQAQSGLTVNGAGLLVHYRPTSI